jgi:hypothetical protein
MALHSEFAQFEVLIVVVDWKDGIIGRVERFLLDRFPIGKMTARAFGIIFVSIALSNVKLHDKLGMVKANMWFVKIGRSGFAYKSPTIRFLRRFTLTYNQKFWAPGKFTTEGLTEYITGAPKRKRRNEIEPHRTLLIARDEVSGLMSSVINQRHFCDLFEYLCMLWDGYIEGYYTRQYQWEGNVAVYCSMLMMGSERTYDLLSEDFFHQGAGNRPLYICELEPLPEKLTHMFFFSSHDDAEENTFFAEIIKDLNKLEYYDSVLLDPNASRLWREFQHAMMCDAYNDTSLESMYKIKLPLNTLKLAINYAASRLNFLEQEKIIQVAAEDMQRAIDDSYFFLKMYQSVIKNWQNKRKTKYERNYKTLHNKVINALTEPANWVIPPEPPHQQMGYVNWKSVYPKLGSAMPRIQFTIHLHRLQEAGRAVVIDDEEQIKALWNKPGRKPKALFRYIPETEDSK